VAGGKHVIEAREKLPLENDSGGGVDVPDRAEAALSKKTLTSEWGIPPWQHDRLSCKDLQDVRLAERAEAYIQQQQRADAQNQQQGRRSARNSERYRDYKHDMEARYGDMT